MLNMTILISHIVAIKPLKDPKLIGCLLHKIIHIIHKNVINHLVFLFFEFACVSVKIVGHFVIFDTCSYNQVFVTESKLYFGVRLPEFSHC